MARDRKLPFRASSRFAFRTPLLPLSLFTEWGSDVASVRAVIARLLDDPAIADALFVASPDLHKSLQSWRDEPDSQRGQRVERSLVRYISRMCSRPTPFGLFAAVSVGRFGDSETESCIALPARTDYGRSTRLDNDYLFAVCEAAVGEPSVRERLAFRPNSSLYEVAGRLRYAEARLDGRSRSHHLVAVEPSEYLDNTLERAREGSLLAPLTRALVADDPEIVLEEAIEFVGELVDSQMLVSDLSPNVTGEEPIHHTIAELRRADCASFAEPLEKARDAIAAIDAAGPGAPAQSYLDIAETLEPLPTPIELGRLFQVDSVAQTPDAALHPRVLTEVVRGIELLQRLSPPEGETSLTRFRDAFSQRYESREVPLCVALDEEVGIGFDASNAPAAEASPLLAGLPFPPDPNRVPQVRWRDRERHLFELLIRAASESSREIVLSKKDIETLSPTTSATMPDAFSVMTTIVASSAADIDKGNFRFVLEGAGGPSGARILGRFCLASDEHRELVQEHLAAEEALRPDAVFAEIAHLPEGRIGNILCRPVLREHEIPFLGLSGAPRDRQIPLDDLFVSVQGQRVVLRSHRLGREVLPRMSTAHNYEAGSLGIYRFLCSLQGQGGGGVGWGWGPFAFARFRPRVRFGRHILSRAAWILDEDDIKPLAEACKGAKKATKPDQIRALRDRVFEAASQLRQRRDLPRFVLLSDSDNELPIDFENPLSVDSFVALIKGREGSELTEMISPDDVFVEGPDGLHTHQLVIPFVRELEPRMARLEALPAQRSGRYPPGSEWLYAKLYTGTSTADDVLRECIFPIAKAVIASGDADQWFFIRYGDPDWHLRVRFRGDPAKLRDAVLPRLEAAAAELIRDGYASRFQLDTYDQELSRYGGAAGIELAEELFWADSDAVCEIVELLEGDEGAAARWQLCLRGIDMLLDDFGFDLPAKRQLMGRVRDGFAEEHFADTAFKKELGKRFRNSQADLLPILARDPAVDASHPFEPGFAALARRSPRQQKILAAFCAKVGDAPGVLEDVALSCVHMHANRLLRSAQRAHELVLYDFLRRHYDMLTARAKSRPTS